MKIESLEPRAKPSQSRAEKTVERILETTGEMLETHGFEKLTTNKICEAASMTPPALYRYFPNKYAIVSKLAERLMELQNKDMVYWGVKLSETGFTADSLSGVLKSQVQITRDFPGGTAILKTLYATPQLAEIRLTSHRETTEALASLLPDFKKRLGKKEALRRLRLAIEIGNSVIEMIVENDELDERATIRDAAEIIEFYLAR